MISVDYLLIGHVTADLIPNGRMLGGTVAYAAPVVQAFGHRGRVFTSAAPDEPLLRSLHAQADISLRVADHTTTFENRYVSDGRIQYVHHHAAPLTPDWLPMAWRDVGLVHLAPLVNEVSVDFAACFPDATILLTPQGYLRQWDDTGRVSFANRLSAAMLSQIDIIVLSKEDIAEAPEIERILAAAVPHCIITEGNRGGVYYHNGSASHYDPVPVTESYPTGAGDVFAAALLASLPSFDGDVAAAIDVARHLAAESVKHKGTEGITAALVQKILDTNISR